MDGDDSNHCWGLQENTPDISGKINSVIEQVDIKHLRVMFGGGYKVITMLSYNWLLASNYNNNANTLYFFLIPMSMNAAHYAGGALLRFVLSCLSSLV